MRFEHWLALLSEFIESRRHTPFVWGVTDCTLFAADAVLAMTGVDLAADYRGTYDDIKSALRLIQKAGGLAHYVKLEPIDILFAGRGDIVLLDMPGGAALGVHLGRHIAAQGNEGLVFLPIDAAKKAWKGEL